MSYVSLDEMNAESGNDCWGWTDTQTGKEQALMGLDNGTAIIDISTPTDPSYQERFLQMAIRMTEENLGEI